MAEIDLEKFKGHTEGPWRYQDHSDAYTHIVRGPNNCFVLNAPQGTRGADEANARLAAAAPDLLAELTKARQAIRGLREALETSWGNVLTRAMAVRDGQHEEAQYGISQVLRIMDQEYPSAALASTKEYE